MNILYMLCSSYKSDLDLSILKLICNRDIDVNTIPSGLSIFEQLEN